MSKSAIPTIKIVVEHHKKTRLVDLVVAGAAVFAAGVVFRAAKKIVQFFKDTDEQDKTQVHVTQPLDPPSENETTQLTEPIVWVSKPEPKKSKLSSTAVEAVVDKTVELVENALDNSFGRRLKRKFRKISMKLIAHQLDKLSKKEF